MYISNELFTFFKFVLVGMLISLIFDFFRAYRKLNKVSNRVVIIQDILYFIIATVIVTLSIVLFLDTMIRLYIFIAIILGAVIYLSIFSKYIVGIYSFFMRLVVCTFHVTFIPIQLIVQMQKKIFEKIILFCKKRCKKFLYMVQYICKVFKWTKPPKIHLHKRDNMETKDIKKVGKKEPKRKVFKWLCLCFAVYFVYTVVCQQISLNSYNSQIKMYAEEISNDNSLIEYYNGQKSNVKTDEYIESVAREKLGYVKPYEKIFVDVNNN